MPRVGARKGSSYYSCPIHWVVWNKEWLCKHHSPREIHTINQTINQLHWLILHQLPSFIAHTTLIPWEGQKSLHRTLLHTGLLKETLQSAIQLMCLPGAFAWRQEQLTAKEFLIWCRPRLSGEIGLESRCPKLLVASINGWNRDVPWSVKLCWSLDEQTPITLKVGSDLWPATCHGPWTIEDRLKTWQIAVWKVDVTYSQGKPLEKSGT